MLSAALAPHPVHVLSSAIFVLALVLEELRRLTFGALGRFVFVAVLRRYFMASPAAAKKVRRVVSIAHRAASSLVMQTY